MSEAIVIAVVVAKGLRLRAEPSLDSTVLRALPRGAKVRVQGQSPDGLWTNVEELLRTGSARGWMASKYLAVTTHPAASAPLREEPWMTVALHELGVREAPGSANNPRVLAYLASVELDRAMAGQDETPWCSAFVNWCIEVAGFVGTNSAAARSWLSWGQSLPKPRRGCITVLSREGGGHVGFWVSQTPSVVRLLGGNQGNRVCEADYAASRILGHRVPT